MNWLDLLLHAAIAVVAVIASWFLNNYFPSYPEAYIHIGNNVGISGATIYARKGITIGDNTAIGGNCKILDAGSGEQRFH